MEKSVIPRKMEGTDFADVPPLNLCPCLNFPQLPHHLHHGVVVFVVVCINVSCILVCVNVSCILVCITALLSAWSSAAASLSSALLLSVVCIVASLSVASSAASLFV